MIFPFIFTNTLHLRTFTTSSIISPPVMSTDGPPLPTVVSPALSFQGRRPSNEAPKVQFHRGTTAAQLLAAFSPTSPQQPKTVSPPKSEPPKYNIKMTQPSRPSRDLRNKQPVSYEISDDEDGSPSTNAGSTFSTPRKPVVYLEEEYELYSEPEPEPAGTPPPRQSSAGHSLRQRSDLHLSLRAQENGDKTVARKRKSHRRKQVQRSAAAPPRTARNEVRDQIASETAGKRANFFIAKKEYFLPLLPESNHVQRLVDQRNEQYGGVEELGVPYEAFNTQPQGYGFLTLIALYCKDNEAHSG